MKKAPLKKLIACILIMAITITSIPITSYASGTSHSKAISVKLNTTKKATLQKGKAQWYTFKTSAVGDYHIKSTGKTNVIVTVYKKNILGKLKKVGSNGSSKVNFDFYLALSSKTKYYMKVEGKTSKIKGAYSFKVLTKDTYISKEGGSWTPIGTSTSYYKIYRKIIYLPKDKAQTAFVLKNVGVTDSMLKDGGTSLAASVAGELAVKQLIKLGILSSGSTAFTVLIAYPFLSKTFLDYYDIKQFKKAGKYDAKKGVITKPVRIICQRVSSPLHGTITVYLYETWDGKTMESAPNSKGKFSTTDFSVLKK